jgi:hypothetical protein
MNAREVTAFKCGECDTTYTLKVAANLCCMPKECACGVTIQKTRWRCEKCKDHADKLKWECAERKPLPKDGWLYSERYDRYFDGVDEILDGGCGDEIERGDLLSLSEFAREYQIYICEPKIPASLNLHEEFEDFYHEDDELPGDWEAAEKVIEDWIASVPANQWPLYPTEIAWNGEYLSEVEQP